MKKALFGVIIIAFVTRLLLLLYFPLKYTDYYLINAAAENFINGHGLGFTKVYTADLSQFQFEGLRLWPPLVTLLTALLLKITGSIQNTDLTISILLLLLLFVAIHILFQQLKLSVPLQMLGYIFLAVNPEIIKQPGHSDLAAATFCIGACAACINLLQRQQKQNIIIIAATGCLFFLPSAFRYQFYPISFMFPMLIIGSGIILHEKKLQKTGKILFGFITFFIIIQELFLAVYTKQPLTQSVAMDNTGLYFTNLAFIYPVFLKTFVNVSYLENQYGTIFQKIAGLYSAVIIIAFAGYCYLITKRIRKIYNTATAEHQKQKALSNVSLLLTMLLPIAILIMLSICYNSRTGFPGGWTYVREGRYYIVPSLLILTLTLWYIQEIYDKIKPQIRKGGMIIMGLVLSYNSALTVKFFYNIIINNIPDKEVKNRNDRSSIENLLNQFSNEGHKTIVCSDEPYFTHYTYKPSIAIGPKITGALKTELKSGNDVQVLIIAQKPVTENDRAFIDQTKAKKIKTINTSTLYLGIIKSTRNE